MGDGCVSKNNDTQPKVANAGFYQKRTSSMFASGITMRKISCEIRNGFRHSQFEDSFDETLVCMPVGFRIHGRTFHMVGSGNQQLCPIKA